MFKLNATPWEFDLKLFESYLNKSKIFFSVERVDDDWSTSVYHFDSQDNLKSAEDILDNM